MSEWVDEWNDGDRTIAEDFSYDNDYYQDRNKLIHRDSEYTKADKRSNFKGFWKGLIGGG